MIRPNREGVLRQIKNIKSFRKSFEQMTSGFASQNRAKQEQNENKISTKINIFDEAKDLKNRFVRNSYNSNTALVPLRKLDEIDFSSTQSFSSTKRDPFASKAIDYCKVGRETKETASEFVRQSRDILRSQIQIDQKRSETQRLGEYIVMEQERLNMKKMELEADKEKFQMTMIESERNAKIVVQQVRENKNIKNELTKKIDELQNKIMSKDAEYKKKDETLTDWKELKKFLDILSIQAGRKKYTPMLKVDEFVQIDSTSPSKLSNEGHSQKNNKKGKSTFITGVDK